MLYFFVIQYVMILICYIICLWIFISYLNVHVCMYFIVKLWAIQPLAASLDS